MSGREGFFRNMCVPGQRVWVMAVWRFCFFEQTTQALGLNVPDKMPEGLFGLAPAVVRASGRGSVLFSGGEPWPYSQTLACPPHVQA